MRRAAWLLAAMLAVALLAPRAALWAAQQTVYFKDVRNPTSDFGYAFTLPIHVVQAAYPGWNVVLIVWTMLALLALLGVLFARAVATEGAHASRLVIGGFILVGGVLTLCPIVQSADPYYYVMYGRIYGLLGVNPYFLPKAVDIGSDPTLHAIMRFAGNPPFATPYGPLWTLLSGGIAVLERGAGLWLQAYSYRVLALACGVALIAALLYAARKRGDAGGAQGAALVAFHPLVLYETAVGAHNDIVMVAPAAWAFALVDSMPLIAGLLLGAAIGIKIVAVVALPFLAVRAARQSPLTAVLVVIVCAAVAGLCLKPFYIGANGAHSLGGEASYLAMSLTWLLNLPIFSAGFGHGPAFPSLPALPLVGELSWPRIVQLAVLASFAAIGICSLVRDIRMPNLANLWRTITALLWALPLVHPWYAEWLIAGIAQGGRWRAYIWWFGALIMGLYAVDGISGQALPGWVLVVLTVTYLAVPTLIALRSPRDEPATPT
jgi:hypothetical protein